MKTAKELEQGIKQITELIHQEFPALAKNMKELPVKDLAIADQEIYAKNLEAHYNNLVAQLGSYSKKHANTNLINNSENLKFSGYPLYPPADDIYNHGKKEMDLDPNDLSKKKSPNEAPGTANEKEFKNHMTGEDLDVPGSELDDEQENIGSEDEENNYYSLGGDDHNDLEEDRG